MKEDTFSEAAAKFYIAELIQAVSSVHALGYIHRDLKPDNVLLGNITTNQNHTFSLYLELYIHLYLYLDNLFSFLCH